MTRCISRPCALPCLFAFLLLFLGLAAAPAAAQQCDESVDWFLITSCSTGANACEVGETATFNLVGITEVSLGGECEPLIRCCAPSILNPNQAWYNGERKVNGQWVVDADCVNAPNPLEYTYQAADVGEYRRQACSDSSCTECSPWISIEVVHP